MFNKKEIDEIKDYLETVAEGSKIYLGSDSKKYKRNGKFWAKYVVVLVVHIGQKHGAKVFSYEDKELVLDDTPKKLSQRLFRETEKLIECYQEMEEILTPFAIEGNVEIHLDLNSDPNFASHSIVRQAVGYVKGMTGIDPQIKPESMVASHCADHGANHGGSNGEFGNNRNSKPLSKC